MEDLPSDCFEIEALSFESLNQLKPIIKDYLFSDKANQFASFKPDWSGIESAIESRSKFPINRKLLVNELENQYHDIAISSLTNENIQRLKNSTCYSFTTGHQLSLFTGPSYFFYKILSVISLAKRANQKFINYQFVPVFWMATEDHDFEEIAQSWIDGKKVEWKRNASGGVGRLSLEGLKDALLDFEKALGKNPRSSDLLEEMKGLLKSSKTYNEFVFSLVNYLFKDYGLVIIDADSPNLKRQFVSTIKEDIFHNVTFKAAQETAKKLAENGYSEQIMIREINFFYLKEGLRERIEKQGEIFKVLNSNISFDAAEMNKEIKSYPARFSPNVSLRPVYQETILPNAAYIGGGAEVAYWLQLKKGFEKLKTFFPVVLLRDSALVLPLKSKKWLNDLSLKTINLFHNQDKLFEELVKSNAKQAFDLSKQKLAVNQSFDAIKPTAEAIQPTLIKTIEGEKQKILKRLVSVEKKLLREEKRNQKVLEDRLDRIFNIAFPNGSLQERKQNFLPYWVDHKREVLDCLIANFDATKAEFKVLFIKN